MLAVMRADGVSEDRAWYVPAGAGRVACLRVCSQRHTENATACLKALGLANLTQGLLCVWRCWGLPVLQPTMSPAQLRYLPQSALSVCSPPPDPCR